MNEKQAEKAMNLLVKLYCQQNGIEKFEKSIEKENTDEKFND